MFRRLFCGLLTSLLVVGCSSSSPEVSSPRRSDEKGPDLAGGTSGAEGSLAPCEQTQTTLTTLDSVGSNVGFSGRDMLVLANREPEIAIRWPARDSGPMFDASATHMQLSVTAIGDAIEYVCDDPSFPQKYRPKPHLELPVAVTVRTDNGVLDEHFETRLSAEKRDYASIETITLAPEKLGGKLGEAVASFYTAGNRDLVFELNFGPDGAFGWIGGPFSPRKAQPCGYTAYARWPVDFACWPTKDSMRIDDDGIMQPHLARVNQSFDLTWQDGSVTSLTLDARLAEGATCASDGQLSHRVELRVKTGDGRIDITLPADLSGGPVSIDPWPMQLAGVEPFTLQLTATAALDATALMRDFGISQPDVSAAIFSLYLSSPVAINSHLLDGGLRLVAIDRTGFADPLPTADLPGGDSEVCFSAKSAARVMSAQFSRD